MIFSLLLAGMLAFSACAPNDNGEQTGEIDAEIFSLSSSYKIMKEEDASAHYGKDKALRISLAKNEFESAQLFITPKQDVKAWNLEKSALTNANGDKITADQIDVFAQWYHKTVVKSYIGATHRQTGYYPDALVPMKEYREYGYDQIKAGENQGITVRVKTDLDTPAGTYTGTFKLTYGGTTENIPVTVTVWNFTVPEENHVVSALGNPFYQELLGGALDNTPEKYYQYNEYFLDHRINVNNLIYPELPLEEQIEQLKAYCNDERVTAYSYIQEGIPFTKEDTGETLEKKMQIPLSGVENKLRILIENSDPEHNLLKKNFIYALDEPYDNEENASIYVKAIVDLLIQIADEYEAAGKLDDYGLVKEDILSQDILGAFTYQGKFTEVEGLRTYCPLVDGYKSAADRARYERYRQEAYAGANNELADNAYGSTWWYTATSPYEPYPNQHMDAELYPLRATSWMQYEYGVKGYLNWGAFVFVDTKTLNEEVWENANVYDDPGATIAVTNGDGYIVYPGLKFGIDAPLPSLRMLTLTDGFEDYEYLYAFNQLANEYAAKYGELALESLLTPLYRTIYTDVEAYKTPDAVLEARETLAKYIEMLSGEMHALVFVSGVNAATNTVTVDFYAEEGTTFTAGGKTYEGTPYGEGVKISVPCDLGQSSYLDGTLQKGESSVVLKTFLSDPLYSVTTSDSETEKAKFTVTQRYAEPLDHITLSVSDELGELALKAVYGACLNPETYEQSDYMPSLLIDSATMFDDLAKNKVKTVTLRLYNPSDKERAVTLQLRAGNRVKRLLKVQLGKGWNVVNIPNVNEVEWTYKDRVTAFAIAIDLNTEEDVILYVGDVYYSYTE